MLSSLRAILLGTKYSHSRALLTVGVALGVFVIAVAAYTLDLFAVSGGVVWIPFHAALVGTVVAFWIGYTRRGLVFAWIVTDGALLGYHANHAFFGLSGRDFTEQLAYFVRADGLVFLGVEAIVLGTVAFVLGCLLRWGIDSFQHTVAPRLAEQRD